MRDEGLVGAWWFNEPLLVDDVTTVFWRQKKQEHSNEIYFLQKTYKSQTKKSE